jgi:hypothetical protein
MAGVRLTHSSLYLGYVTFAASAPAFLLTPIAGLLADRIERRRVLIWAQVFAMLQAVALAAATLSGVTTANSLLLLSLLLGIINAFENPTRQSFYSERVEPEDMSNAIALNASLVMMRVKRLVRKTGRGNSLKLLGEGFAFVRGKALLAAMLFDFGIFNLAGSPYQTLLPVLATDGLLTGPAGLGWLVAASGLGAIASSLILASRPNTNGLPEASFIGSGLQEWPSSSSGSRAASHYRCS